MEDTIDYNLNESKAAPPSTAAGRVRVDVAGKSDRGLVRSNNEDHYMVSQFGRYLMPVQTNVAGQEGTAFVEEGYGLVVADGLGGAAAGEIASDLAIRALLNLVFQTPDWIISREYKNAQRVMERMAERYRKIDELITAQGAADSRLQGMGTTMTLACNLADMLILTHVGDSRAYLYRAGKLHQLTCDHTAAQSLVDQGILDHTDQADERLRHTLVRLLGGCGGRGAADVQHLSLMDQDLLVLCTDGLTDMVPDATIAALLAHNSSANEICQSLVDTALKNGGNDNVTVIVARYGFFRHPKA
jgi:protein phosphatase